MSNEALQHHGIIGMKWGIRRSEAQLARARGKVASLEEKVNRKKGVSSQPSSTSTNPAKPQKRVKDMTDEELQAKIRRLQMEKQLKDLMGSEEAKKTQSKGKSFIMSVLETSGKNIATQAATYALGSAVNSAVKKVSKGKITDDIVNPKKGQKDK